jgi:hypothetical protein
MRRFLIAVAALIAAFSFAPTKAHAQGGPTPPAAPPMLHGPFWPNDWIPWVAFGCPSSIILSALVADFKDNRQLTYWEAWTCGLLYWIPLPPKPKHHHMSELVVDRPRVG